MLKKLFFWNHICCIPILISDCLVLQLIYFVWEEVRGTIQVPVLLVRSTTVVHVVSVRRHSQVPGTARTVGWTIILLRTCITFALVVPVRTIPEQRTLNEEKTGLKYNPYSTYNYYRIWLIDIEIDFQKKKGRLNPIEFCGSTWFPVVSLRLITSHNI